MTASTATEVQDVVECDVLVVGSGAGGLSAALAAAKRGLKTIVAEKASGFGGISAWSGGWIWIPCSHLALRDNVQDSLDNVRQYLKCRLGEQYETPLVEAYLSAGPRMVEEYMRDTAVQFEGGGYIFPDYFPDAPGALHGSGASRSLRPVPFDGRQLARATLSRMRPMLEQLTLHGMLIGSLVETGHFVNATRSLTSARFVARKTLRFLRDRVLHGRDMSLVNGAALIARLAHSLDKLAVPIWVDSPATALIIEDAGVKGAILLQRGRRVGVRASRGVVLACGGFSHDEARKARFYSHVARGARHLAVAPESNTGDGLTLGEQAGGRIVEGRPWNCLFMPASLLPGKTGSAAVFPHIWDRSKPGFIAVTPRGERFVNEAASYMEFGQAMVRANPEGDVRAFLICDSAAIRRYGLGAARPMLPLGPHVRSGYLVRAGSIVELARRLGIPPATLQATVSEYNADAATGRDRRFGKGDDPFSRFQGDPDVVPNPNLGPVAQPPFYAVELLCSDFGTFTGLRTSEKAQVLGEDGRPIPGLYAAGNDMATMMGSHSVGGGITLGPAMVFGYVAGCALAEEAVSAAD